MRGIQTEGGIPVWAAVLTAAGGDPLRAQQMEAELSQEWWERWVVYVEEKGKAMELEAEQARAKAERRRRT